MAHKVCGKLACESSTVRVAPKKLCSLAVSTDFDNAEICFGIIVNVLEIFARTGNDEYLADKCGSVKAERDVPDLFIYVEVFGNLVFV